jgi:hypothetical protein
MHHRRVVVYATFPSRTTFAVHASTQHTAHGRLWLASVAAPIDGQNLSQLVEQDSLPTGFTTSLLVIHY